VQLVKDKPSGQALEILETETRGILWIEKEFGRFQALAKKNIDEWLTLTERNEVKRWMDKFARLFTEPWAVRSGTNKIWAVNIRNSLQKGIESDAKKFGIKENIKELNKNTQVSFTLGESIAKKESADQVRELVTAFAPWGALALGGAFAPAESNFERLQNIIGWFILWQVAGSTKLKTGLASTLNKLSWLEKIELQNFIRTKGAAILSQEIVDKLVTPADK